MGDENPMSSSTGAIKKKKDEKGRRRDHRSWDNVIRSTSNLSDSEKIAVIQDRYNEIYSELRKTSGTLTTVEKQYSVLQKERDHIQAELTKNILAKAKLESLCRELQKHNKVIKEENITRVKEEEERRREVATSFTEKLNSLTNLMDENKDKSVRLREENMSMTTKLTELYDQFQERESHLSNMNHQMDLQKQLSETQLRKLQVEIENERQLFDQERQVLTANLERSEQTNCILEANMKSLQEHLKVYKGQYSDFETTMAKSSKVFDAFKAEMAILQKTNSTLEQEKNEYLTRWQSCTNSIVQMSELHQQTVSELKVYEKKMPVLERICRQLQAERSAYQRQLQENNITPVFVPQSHDDQPETPRPCISTPPPVLTISHTAQKKLTKKEKLLVALKSELKVMEDELKVATKQQEVARGNQEAAMRRQEVEKAIAVHLGEIDMLERENDQQAGPSTQPDKPQKKLKLVKSAPLAGTEPKRPSSAKSSSSSSSAADNLLIDLSLDAIPLYKPKAATDIGETEEVCLLKESEAHTDLLQPNPEEDQLAQGDRLNVGEEVEEDREKSALTIPLKPVEGKTEIHDNY